jgi:hypothetical protein
MSLRVQILDYKYTDSTKTVIDWDASVIGELEITNHADFPLAMTFQISDFKDITSTSGDYSKTFKFPASKNNNNILKHLYTPNINIGNNITEKKPCRIISDGMYTQLGLIKITGVGGYGKIPSSYSGVFYGNNLTWATDLGDAYMNTLDWGSNGENLEYNKTSIMATWQDEDCNTNPNSYIVYPITSYGQYNAEGDTRTIQLLDTASVQPIVNGSTGYYGYDDDGNDYGTPKPVPDWRPAVFVKNTLDKLFGSVGYKISSDFMDTDEFKKKTWLLPNFKYNNPDAMYDDYSVESNFENGVTMTTPDWGLSTLPTEDGIQDFNITAISEDDGNEYYTGSGREVLDIQMANLTVNLDNGSYVDLANNWVEIGEYGNYNVDVSGIESKLNRGFTLLSYWVELQEIKTTLNLEVQTVGHSSWNVIDSLSNNMILSQTSVRNDTDTDTPYFENASSADTNSHFFNKGDKIRLTLGVKVALANTYDDFLLSVFFRAKSNSSFDIKLDPNNVEYGQTYNLTDVMNPDYKQIDFIKGIAHTYNLQMTTDESNKTIYIEPFDEFYKPYKDAENWTEKVSKGREITDKWIENDLKRSLVFKYKSDSADGKVKHRGERFFDNVEDEYPYRETLPTTFEKGDSVFENPFFAGTYNAKDMATTSNPNVDTAYSACLWKENVSSNDAGRPDKGFEFLPRLLYWNKYSPDGSTVGLNKLAQVQTWLNINKIIVAKSAIPVVDVILSNIYPQATMVNRDSTTSPVLSYGNVYVRDYDDATGVYTAYQTGRGLYDTYYKNMVEMLKRSPRLRTISFDLKVSDIINLDFRKLVFVDGVYWRINRVVDYMPNQNNPTKVELIEWFQIGVFAATAPAYGSSGDSSNWGVGGSYTQSTSSESEPPNSF